MTETQIATYLFLGACGGFLHELNKRKGVVLLPRRWKGVDRDGQPIHGWDLGCVTGLVIGAAAGLIIDSNPFLAFTGAYTGASLTYQAAKRKDDDDF